MDTEQLRELEDIQNQLGESLREANAQAKENPNVDSFLDLAEKLAYKTAYERCMLLLHTLTENPNKEDPSVELSKDL